MLKAYLKPDYNVCCACIDRQVQYLVRQNCNVCPVNTKECEVLQIGTRLFGGDFAFILVDNKIRKVPLSDLVDVRKVD